MTVPASGRARSFYVFIGLAICAVVLLGFARTYYLRAWFHVPPLTVTLQVHALVLTLWVVLFVVQSRLIVSGHRQTHRQLGMVGLALAGLVVVATYSTAVEAARTGPSRNGLLPVDRFYSSVVVLVLFGVAVTLAAVYRRQREIHRRLMLLSTIAIVGPAATRAVAVVVGHGVRDSHIPVMAALVLAAVTHDWRVRGRPHWVLLTGGMLLIASQLTRRMVGTSEWWAHVGGWLLR
jgi:hypothetical protein